MALGGSALPRFYIYDHTAFPTPEQLHACPKLRRLEPLNEPMAQFYAEQGLYQQLMTHPARVRDPSAATLFYVPLLAHLSSDAGRCNGSSHRTRMSSIAATLRASPVWQRRNGTDHFWTCACVMMRGMIGNELWQLLGTALHAVHSVPRARPSSEPANCSLRTCCTVTAWPLHSRCTAVAQLLHKLLRCTALARPPPAAAQLSHSPSRGARESTCMAQAGRPPLRVASCKFRT